MMVMKPEFAMIEAESLTIEIEKDFWDALQFQHMCPLSTFRGGLRVRASGQGVPKSSHFGR